MNLDHLDEFMYAYDSFYVCVCFDGEMHFMQFFIKMDTFFS